MNKRKIKRINSTNITIDEALNNYCNELISKGVTKKSIENTKNVLYIFKRDNQLDGDEVLSTIDESVIHSWTIKMLDSDLKTASVNSYLARMRAFLYWCMNHELIKRFKVKLVKYQQQPVKYFTDDELRILTKKPNKDDFVEYRTWCIICFILATGARAGTISEIKLEDVDFKAHTVAYRHLKNKNTAIIPLSNSIVNILTNFLHDWNTGSEYLFTDVSGNQLSVSAIRQALEKYEKRRGVKVLGPHALRHSFARGWIRNGGGAFQLQQMLTHSDLTMTRRYVQLFSDDIEVESYNPLDSIKHSENRTKRVQRMR
ncbi:MAG: tyrosine-type recombinase/integrase [Anaerovoracaceae bacterium]|jgi:integrase/recombinase XerD